MTFHSSLHKSTFRRFFFKGLPLSLIPLVMMSNQSLMSNYMSFTSDNMVAENGEKIKAADYYLYRIMDYVLSEEMDSILFAAIGLIFAVFLFWVIDSKKMMTVYYSLGLTRKQLFGSIYAAGAVLLSLSVILPLTANAVLNVVFLGNCAILWTQTIYYILFITGLMLFGFSIGAFCMAGTGTVFEGALNGLAFSLLPFYFGKSLLNLTKRYLNGAAFNLKLAQIAIEKPTEKIADGTIGTLPKNWNPFTFGEILFGNKYGTALKETKNVPSLWNDAGANFCVIFIIAAAVLLAVLALRKFSHRKSELCGVPAAAKYMNLCGVTVYGFFVVCAVASMLPLNYILSAVIALLIFVVLFFSVSCFSEHSFRLGFEHWKQCVASVAVLGGMIIILSTGMFGYSSYIPKAEDVRSARVTAVHNEFSEAPLPGLRQMSLDVGYGSSGALFRTMTQLGSFSGSYFDESEISKVTSLHEKLIESKGYTEYYNSNQFSNASRDIVVCYTLKNGKTVTRYFRNVNDEALEADILIHQNHFYKSEMIEKAKNILTVSDETKAVIAPFYEEHKAMDLTEEQCSELFKAIEKDITAQTAEERFYPKTQILGYLGYIVSGMEQRNEMFSDGYSTYIMEIDEEQPEKAAPFLTITPDMKNTISLIQKWGYGDIFAHRPETTTIYAFDERKISEKNFYQPFVTSATERHFYDDMDTDFIESSYLQENEKLVEIKNKKQISEILSVAQPWYPTTRGGYQIIIKTSKEKARAAFIPEDKAPEWMKAEFGNSVEETQLAK